MSSKIEVKLCHMINLFHFRIGFLDTAIEVAINYVDGHFFLSEYSNVRTYEKKIGYLGLKASLNLFNISFAIRVFYENRNAEFDMKSISSRILRLR